MSRGRQLAMAQANAWLQSNIQLAKRAAYNQWTEQKENFNNLIDELYKAQQSDDKDKSNTKLVGEVLGFFAGLTSGKPILGMTLGGEIAEAGYEAIDPNQSKIESLGQQVEDFDWSLTGDARKYGTVAEHYEKVLDQAKSNQKEYVRAFEEYQDERFDKWYTDIGQGIVNTAGTFVGSGGGETEQNVWFDTFPGYEDYLKDKGWG
tara:strand:- start:1843 stop:2457 length:615 start_codon:yes stop_codon:yes gene_type:complete